MLGMNGHKLDEAPLAAGVAKSYEIVPTQIEHVYELAETMREADRKEIADLGIGVKKALYRAFRNSILCRVALVDARVAAMWGLAVGLRDGVSPLSDLGVPWLHTSAAVEALPIAFMREAKSELAAMKALRPRLESFVAADYAQAVKFLRILGFTVEKPEPVGLDGAMFSRFHMGFDS